MSLERSWREAGGLCRSEPRVLSSRLGQSGSLGGTRSSWQCRWKDQAGQAPALAPETSRSEYSHRNAASPLCDLGPVTSLRAIPHVKIGASGWMSSEVPGRCLVLGCEHGIREPMSTEGTTRRQGSNEKAALPSHRTFQDFGDCVEAAVGRKDQSLWTPVRFDAMP